MSQNASLKKMKIVITGSHLTPALAVIDRLKEVKDLEIVYMGRKTTREGDPTPSVESAVISKMGIRFIGLTAGRMQRSFTRYTIPSLLKVPIGLIQALYFILSEKPNLVLSFGGYVALPVVVVAWLFSIPIIVHEQTLVPGLTNRICSLLADRVAVTFTENRLVDSPKAVLTGNPLRQNIISNSRRNLTKALVNFTKSVKTKHQPLILITGGNQGSHIINSTVDKILPKLIKNCYLIHQTGDSAYQDFERLTDQKKKLENPDKYYLAKWHNSEDFGYVLKQADLVITRGGINTLLELAYLSIPALIIPIPYVTGDEQTVNARFFAKHGLAKVILQSELTPEKLLDTVSQMLTQLEDLKKQAKQAQELVIPDADQRLVLEVLLLLKNEPKQLKLLYKKTTPSESSSRSIHIPLI